MRLEHGRPPFLTRWILLLSHLELFDLEVLLQHVLTYVASIQRLLSHLYFFEILVQSLINLWRLRQLLSTLGIIVNHRCLFLNIKCLILASTVPHAWRKRPQVNYIHVVYQ